MTKRGLPRAFTDRLERPTGHPEEWFLGSLQSRVLQTLYKQGPSSVREIADALRDKPRYTMAELRDRMAKYLVDGIVEDFGDVALAHFAGALDRVDRRRLARLRKTKDR